MARPWFRMYTEFVSDPKVQLLAFEDQRHFVALLCLKGNGILDSETHSTEYRDRMIARALGLSIDAALEARRRLSEVGIISDNWQPVKWESRQYASDSSAERTAAYRQRKSQERHRDVTVTDKNRTEQNRTDKKKLREVAVPEVIGLSVATWNKWLEYRKSIGKPLKPASYHAAAKALANHGTNQGAVVEQSIAQGWAGLFELKAAKFDQRGTQPTDSDALRKLADRRSAIGLPDFRDPRQGESADDYRNAQDAEYKRRQTSRAAPKFAAELAQQKRIA